MSSPPAPREPLRLDLEDIRCWLLEQIDGGEEVKGHDSMLSTYINTIDAALAALPSEITEPRGCPTPGACSAVEELADLKQRILPQANGRAERAEKARQMAVVERDEMLEKLRAATSMPCAPSATGAIDLNEFVRVARTFSDEHYQNSLVAELRRVYRAQEETAIGNARYEHLRTLNPRKFSELYNEAMVGVYQFDDLVDRYRDARGLPK